MATATLSVAMVLSVVAVPFLKFVLVPCFTVGAATVGAVVSRGAVTVTVIGRLSTGAPFDGVAVSLNDSVAFGAPFASVGAVNEAFVVDALASVTGVPDT